MRKHDAPSLLEVHATPGSAVRRIRRSSGKELFSTLAAESIRSSWQLVAESAQRRMCLIDRHGSTPKIAESVQLTIFVSLIDLRSREYCKLYFV